MLHPPIAAPQPMKTFVHRSALLSALLFGVALHAGCDAESTSNATTDGTTGLSGGRGGSGGGSGGSGGSGGDTSTGGGAGGAGGTGGSLPAMCSSSVATDDYVAGMTKVGENGYSVILVESEPAPPIEGDNAWSVQVFDPAGEAQSGLLIDVYPFMPDHGHGTAVKAVVTPAGADGKYAIEPINLFMSGVWVVSLKLLDPVTEVEMDRVKLSFCVGL